MKRDDLLDLNEALQHPGKKIVVDLTTELPEVEDVDMVEPLEGFLEAVSTGNMLLVTGEFQTKCVFECARCSAAIDLPVRFEMSEEFPVEGVPSAFSSNEFAKVVDDEGEPLFHENQLMVEALLRQGLLLNLPVQPLCEHGWDGDCPIAKGQNMPDAHAKPEDNPHLEDLKKIAKQVEPS